MVTRVFRTAIFAGVMLALWTLGRPARAATLAPFCDDRGATALAPPPALEAPDEAIRRAAAVPCDTDGPMFPDSCLALSPAHRTVRATSPGDEAAASVLAPQLLPPPLDGPFLFVVREAPPSAGVRYRVERPPRG